MNYIKIYDAIVQRAKTRQLEGYAEQHHIIPRCLGGDNSKANLVRLTAREHFICHLLLVDIYPNNKKLIYALWAMCNQKNRDQERYVPSSRAYAHAKHLFSNSRRGVPRPNFSGQNHPSYGKVGYWAGKSNEEQSIRMQGFGNPNSGKRTKSAFQCGDMNPKPWKGKVGPNKGLTGKLNWNSRGVTQFDKSDNFIAHFDAILEAERATGVRNSNIVQCCKGKLKTAGGFVWKYD